MAFGFGKDTADNKLQARIDELEAKLSEAQAEAKLARAQAFSKTLMPRVVTSDFSHWLFSSFLVYTQRL